MKNNNISIGEGVGKGRHSRWTLQHDLVQPLDEEKI